MSGRQSSKRCSQCGINWSLFYNVCRNCDGHLDLIEAKPHSEEEIEALMVDPQPDTRDKVTEWRFEELISHGLGLDHAQSAAALNWYEFDIEEFRALRLKGCSAESAYDILR